MEFEKMSLRKMWGLVLCENSLFPTLLNSIPERKWNAEQRKVERAYISLEAKYFSSSSIGLFLIFLHCRDVQRRFDLFIFYYILTWVLKITFIYISYPFNDLQFFKDTWTHKRKVNLISLFLKRCLSVSSPAFDQEYTLSRTTLKTFFSFQIFRYDWYFVFLSNIGRNNEIVWQGRSLGS